MFFTARGFGSAAAISNFADGRAFISDAGLFNDNYFAEVFFVARAFANCTSVWVFFDARAFDGGSLAGVFCDAKGFNGGSLTQGLCVAKAFGHGGAFG